MIRTPRALAVVLLIAAPLPFAFSGRSEAQAHGTKTASPSPVLLKVGGAVSKPLELTAAALADLPRETVRIKDQDGKEVVYEGVALAELLETAGFQFGQALRGPALASYLVVEASDGYRAVFALPELDPASTDRVIILADRRDGKPIDAKEGPLRVIVPGEKKHSRWVRQVVALKVGKA